MNSRLVRVALGAHSAPARARPLFLWAEASVSSNDANKEFVVRFSRLKTRIPGYLLRVPYLRNVRMCAAC